jgi:anti-sigma factor RsiW
MIQNIHDHALSLGPCADAEFELIELNEGALDPARARLVQQHVEHCPRCRAYLSALAELDTALAEALPAPQLSAGFDARLAAQVAELTRTPSRTAALAAAASEHERMLQSLGRDIGWRTVLNAVALASAVGGVLVGLNDFAPGLLAAHGWVPAGLSASATFSVLLGVACLVGGVLYAQRAQAGPTLLAD